MKRRNVTAFIAAAAMTVSMLLSGCGGLSPCCGGKETPDSCLPKRKRLPRQR